MKSSKFFKMSKLNRWLAQFQQHMCDMDPTIKLNTSFFQLATISMLCLLEDLIFYSPASSAPFARPLPIFQPIFSFQVSGLTRDLLALLEQLLWFYPILFEVKICHFNPNFDFRKSSLRALFWVIFRVTRWDILFFWFYVVCYGVSGCNTCFAMSYGWQLGVYHDDALLLCAKEFNSSMLCHSSKLWKIF